MKILDFQKIDFSLRIFNEKCSAWKNIIFFEKISKNIFAKFFQVDTTSSDLNEFLIGQKILEAETVLLNLSTTFMGEFKDILGNFWDLVPWNFFLRRCNIPPLTGTQLHRGAQLWRYALGPRQAHVRLQDPGQMSASRELIVHFRASCLAGPMVIWVSSSHCGVTR